MQDASERCEGSVALHRIAAREAPLLTAVAVRFAATALCRYASDLVAKLEAAADKQADKQAEQPKPAQTVAEDEEDDEDDEDDEDGEVDAGQQEELVTAVRAQLRARS